jgi:uncharacterized protein
VAAWSGIVAAATFAAAAGAAAAAWRMSDLVLVPPPYRFRPEFTLLGADEERGVVLLPEPPPAAPQFARTDAVGRYALHTLSEGEEGLGLLGPVSWRGDGLLERPIERRWGPFPRAGDPARIDVTLHHRDPLADVGVPFEDVRIAGPVGELAAWWIERPGETAVVMVHGRRRGSRSDALRALPTAVASGLPVLVTSYRNHDASCSAPHGLFTYGEEEADDLLAALAWLRARGIRRVVLVTFSMGGAVAMLARRRWPEAGSASAIDLLGLWFDGPLVDPRSVIRHVARREGLPFGGALAGLGLAVAAARVRVRWSALDLRRLAPSLDVPVVVVGTVDDGTIPIALVDAFTAALPEGLREYWRVEGAGHLEAYNVDPTGYEARLRSFIERTTT